MVVSRAERRRDGRWADLDDRALIRRVQAGETNAYDELVRRYQDVAFRTALVITGDPDDAEDAAQSAFIKAFRALAGFDASRPFRPWLLTIAGNEARNWRTAAARHHRLLESWQAVLLPSHQQPSPEQDAIASETMDAVLAALNGLKQEDREIVTLRYLLDLSEREVAAALDCPAGTVKSRLHRAMTRLRVATWAAERTIPGEEAT